MAAGHRVQQLQGERTEVDCGLMYTTHLTKSSQLRLFQKCLATIFSNNLWQQLQISVELCMYVCTCQQLYNTNYFSKNTTHAHIVTYDRPHKAEVKGVGYWYVCQLKGNSYIICNWVCLPCFIST